MIKPQKTVSHFFQRILRWIYLGSRSVVILSLFLMIIVVVLSVSSRSLTGSGLPGSVEITEYLLVIVGFIGIFHTYHERGHVSVSLIFDRLPLNIKRCLHRFNNFMILVFSLLFIKAGVDRFCSAYQSGETAWFGQFLVPVYFVRLVVPLAFFALFLQCIMDIWKPDIENEESNSS